MSNWSTKFAVKQFQQKKHVSVPNSKVIENKCSYCPSFFFFFFFFFSNHIFWFFFFFFQIFSNSHWFGMYIFFFRSSSFFVFFFHYQVNGSLSVFLFNSLWVPFLSSFFLCFEISLFFPKPPKLLLIQPTKFPPQNT